MAKKSIVMEILKKRLLPYGFKYEGYVYNTWTFSREVEEVSQNIVMIKSPYENAYTLHFDVNEVGESRCRLNDLSKAPGEIQRWFNFNTQEEQINLLNKLGDYIEHYGIPKLNELVVWEKTRVKPFVPTVQMSMKLCEEYLQLAEHFMRRNHAENFTEQEIQQLIKKELVEMSDKNYEDVQEQLVELSAVYTNVYIKEFGGNMRYLEDYNAVILNVPPIFSAELILEQVVNAWQNKEENKLIERYYKISDRVKLYKAGS